MILTTMRRVSLSMKKASQDLAMIVTKVDVYK